MSAKINVQTIQNHAIDFAAYIYHHASIEDRTAIASYGGCIRLGAHPGRVTRAYFEKAMSHVKFDAYLEFRAALFDDEEREYLDDAIAVWVARLDAPRLGRV